VFAYTPCFALPFSYNILANPKIECPRQLASSRGQPRLRTSPPSWSGASLPRKPRAIEGFAPRSASRVRTEYHPAVTQSTFIAFIVSTLRSQGRSLGLAVSGHQERGHDFRGSCVFRTADSQSQPLASSSKHRPQGDTRTGWIEADTIPARFPTHHRLRALAAADSRRKLILKDPRRSRSEAWPAR
jgi:hypothetical protein